MRPAGAWAAARAKAALRAFPIVPPRAHTPAASGLKAWGSGLSLLPLPPAFARLPRARAPCNRRDARSLCTPARLSPGERLHCTRASAPLARVEAKLRGGLRAIEGAAHRGNWCLRLVQLRCIAKELPAGEPPRPEGVVRGTPVVRSLGGQRAAAQRS